MYIEPNTDIYILKDVPLDPTYDHTIYWTGATVAAQKQNQETYFKSKNKFHITDATYQRVNLGKIRVGINAESLYDCNYIMFQNTRMNGETQVKKWFYAFIKSVEYDNERMTFITFQIDVMQTWYFDYELEKCFVEREHSERDTIFYNLTEENLNLGNEYVCNQINDYDMSTMSICILVNRTTAGSPPQTASSVTINNIYTPMNILAGIPVTDPTTIDAFLNQYQEGEIVCVYQYPSQFGDAATTTPVSELKKITPNFATSTGYTPNIDGYVPKNKKLFTYPYNKLIVSNNSGQIGEYKWECFKYDNKDARFNVTGVFITTPAVLCFPEYYRNINNAYDDGLVYSNFPQCAWSGDTFKAWWAQNKASFVTSGISSVLSSVSSGVMRGVAASAFSSNPSIGVASAEMTTGMSIFGSVANSVAKIEDIQNTPSQTYGQTQTDSLNAGMGRIKFNFYNMSIKKEIAQIIDDYFERYGYATKRNKTPNRNVRPYWTYTKTIGCTIKGSIPCDDAKTICDIYNNGITFWNNPNYVGDYTKDNRVDTADSAYLPPQMPTPPAPQGNGGGNTSTQEEE